jgi:hypothetical protein
MVQSGQRISFSPFQITLLSWQRLHVQQRITRGPAAWGKGCHTPIRHPAGPLSTRLLHGGIPGVPPRAERRNTRASDGLRSWFPTAVTKPLDHASTRMGARTLGGWLYPLLPGRWGSCIRHAVQRSTDHVLHPRRPADTPTSGVDSGSYLRGYANVDDDAFPSHSFSIRPC